MGAGMALICSEAIPFYCLTIINSSWSRSCAGAISS